MIYGPGVLFTFLGLLLYFRRYVKLDWKKGDDIATVFMISLGGGFAWPALVAGGALFGVGFLIYKGLLKIPVKE